jgi:putative ABC transport system permease protein
MGTFVQDLRYALRMLCRSPGFTFVAALTLALGIGTNTTIFSGISALLLKPLPYANAGRLAEIQPGGANVGACKAVLVDLRERLRGFDAIASYNLWTFVLTGDGAAEPLTAVRATGNLFDVLGASPLLGRTLLPADSAPGAQRVVVLSYGFWQRHFGSDPGVVGRTLQLSQGSSGGATRVVGVMPPDFAFPTATAQMWAPNPLDPAGLDYDTTYLQLLGRLVPGVGAAAARREVTATVAALCAEDAACNPNALDNARVLPLREALVGNVRPILLLLLGAVGFVLLIGCANVANLLLMRAAVRERELAIRAALGAGRSRVARQLLTESLAIAGIGGALGILTAVWGSGMLRAALPAELLGAADIRVDLRVLAFAGAAVLLAAVLAGLFPAVGATRTNLHAALLDRGAAGAQRARRRALSALVVAEFALALVLAVGAGLMIRTFANLSAEDPGFARAGVLSLQVSTPSSTYDDAADRAFWRELLERVDALPGVQSAGAIHLLPLGVSNWVGQLTIEGRPLPNGEPPRQIDWRVATPGYFETLRIPLLAGRVFTDRDREAGEQVALINETAAMRDFPGEDPVGRRIRTVPFEGEWATIVGVVGDTKDTTLAGPARPQTYRVHAQRPMGAMALLVRTAGNPLQLAGPIRDVVRTIDDDVTVSNVRPLTRVAADSIAQPRLLTGLLFAFGVLALLLGAVGLYGVMAYGTVQRTREFGVRLALGARTREVLGLVARDAIKLAGVGVGVGVAGALMLSRLLESQLYGVTPIDPFAFAGAVVLLAAVALAAALAPALRAARTDPMQALRWE